MAFKLRCGAVFLSRHILWPSGSVSALRQTRHNKAGSRFCKEQDDSENDCVVRWSRWISLVYFSYILMHARSRRCMFFCLVPHITPIIVFPTPCQLRSTGCAERIPHTCPSLPKIDESLSALMLNSHTVLSVRITDSLISTSFFSLFSPSSNPEAACVEQSRTHTQQINKHKDMLTITKPLKNHRNFMCFCWNDIVCSYLFSSHGTKWQFYWFTMVQLTYLCH